MQPLVATPRPAPPRLLQVVIPSAEPPAHDLGAAAGAADPEAAAGDGPPAAAAGAAAAAAGPGAMLAEELSLLTLLRRLDLAGAAAV